VNSSHAGLSVVPQPSPPIAGRVITVSQLMTAEELAAWLQVEIETIYGWTHRRQIPFHKIGPKHLASGNKRDRDSRPLRFDYYEVLEWTRTGALPDWFVRKSR
jgi:excisionase family DNA binding protein